MKGTGESASTENFTLPQWHEPTRCIWFLRCLGWHSGRSIHEIRGADDAPQRAGVSVERAQYAKAPSTPRRSLATSRPTRPTTASPTPNRVASTLGGACGLLWRGGRLCRPPVLRPSAAHHGWERVAGQCVGGCGGRATDLGAEAHCSPRRGPLRLSLRWAGCFRATRSGKRMSRQGGDASVEGSKSMARSHLRVHTEMEFI